MALYTMSNLIILGNSLSQSIFHFEKLILLLCYYVTHSLRYFEVQHQTSFSDFKNLSEDSSMCSWILFKALLGIS